MMSRLSCGVIVRASKTGIDWGPVAMASQMWAARAVREEECPALGDLVLGVVRRAGPARGERGVDGAGGEQAEQHQHDAGERVAPTCGECGHDRSPGTDGDAAGTAASLTGGRRW